MTIALVTGGSRGIGAATCIELARKGFAIAIGFLENEARADVSQKQQRGAGVDAARRPQPAPAEGAPSGEEAREDEPAEHREDRLVIPAPLVAEPEARFDSKGVSRSGAGGRV